MSVSWKKPPCCGLAPQQVEEHLCEFCCWNSQLNGALYLQELLVEYAVFE